MTDFNHLYKRLYPSIANNVTITTGNTEIESRRAIFITYNNINIWFDTLKEYLVRNCFARLKVDGEDGEGELIFLPGQLNRILNLDESGLTLDGNHSKTGGRPSTRYGPVKKVLPKGGDKTNKSSVRITIICGSTAEGHPLPPHFQLKFVAKDKMKRIQSGFVKALSLVWRGFQCGEW